MNIENRLRKNFLGKQIISSLKKEDKLPINKYATPLIIHNRFKQYYTKCIHSR